MLTWDHLDSNLMNTSHPISEIVTIASIIAVVAILSILLNFVSIIVILNKTIFNNAFGILTAYETLNNIGVLVIFLFWSAPTTITGISGDWQFINDHLGRISLFFQTNSFHAMLIVSINRFCAITFPSFYRLKFTITVTYYLIVLVTAIGAAYWAVYFIDGCDFYYKPSDYFWMFRSTPCGSFLANFVDLGYNCSVFGVIAAVDLATLLQLRNANKKMNQISEPGSNQNRNRREIMFFFQAFINSICYAFMLVSFHILVIFAADNRIKLFITTTFAWEAAHLAGGLTLVLFNPEIRRRLLNPRLLLNMESSSNQVQMFRNSSEKTTVPKTTK